MVPLMPVVVIPDLVRGLRLRSQAEFLVQIWGRGAGRVPEQRTLAALDWLQRLELLNRQEQSASVGSSPVHE